MSASNDDTVKLWNTAGKACLATIKGVGSAYTKGKYKKKGPWKFCAARFSKDGSSIFALESTRRPGGPAILCQYGAPRHRDARAAQRRARNNTRGIQ